MRVLFSPSPSPTGVSIRIEGALKRVKKCKDGRGDVRVFCSGGEVGWEKDGRGLTGLS